MVHLTAPSKEAAQIAAALGLDPSRITAFTLRVVAGEFATLTVDMLPDQVDADALVSVLKTCRIDVIKPPAAESPAA